MSAAPVLKLVTEGTPTDRLKRQFKGSLKADRRQMSRRFLRRIGAAAATGALTYGAIKAGAPTALRRAEAFEVGQHAGKVVLGLRTVGRNLAEKAHLGRFMKPGKTDAVTEAFAKKAIGITAAGYMKQGIHGAVKHADKIALGAAGAHLAGGTIHDVRKTRREQNKLARKLLTL